METNSLSLSFFKSDTDGGTGEVAQWFRAISVLIEFLGSDSSSHMEAPICISSFRGSDVFF